MKTAFVFVTVAIILALDQCYGDPIPSPTSLTILESKTANPIGDRLIACPKEVNGRGAQCWWNRRGVRDSNCGSGSYKLGYAYRFGTCYCCYQINWDHRRSKPKGNFV